ncbi:MAG: 23S rRNA (guanosine(2251)-2'-O)-methyltransferase RlmB [Bacteroidales bacterium]
MENYIFGIRPILESLEAGNIPEKILIQKGLTGQSFQQLFQQVRKLEIPYQMVPVEKLNSITRKNHQGVIAQVAMIAYHKLEQVIPGIYEKGETPLLVLLDRITDVRNLGAIARSAECAGAHALVIPEKGSATVTADAIKTSAGALSRLPVCRERELLESISFLQHSGIKVVACTEKAANPVFKANLTGPLALIMGSEDKGISTACLRMADDQVSIPQAGKTASLNVSVAAGVVLFEILRQKNFNQ